MSRPDIGTTRSPYSRPVIKEPVWTWEIPLYFYAGGLAGASAGLAFGAGRAGNDELARRSWGTAMAGVAVSPLLLTSDLGKPLRFLNMLRVLKVTSPMSVGSWILTAAGATTALASLHEFTGRGRGPAAVARPLAAAFGLPLTTYTAALVANTAVPAWHAARHELPFVFGASAVASAGAVATALTSPRNAGPARGLAVGGAIAEVALFEAMERRLGFLRGAYSEGEAGRFGKAGKGLNLAGAAVIAAAGRRSRLAAAVGGALVSAASVATRWSVFKAGSQSAANPDHTIVPQRERIDAGEAKGAARDRRSSPARADGRTGSPAIGVFEGRP